MIETQRWNKVPLEDRICPKCHLRAVEDEYHFMLTCPLYIDIWEHLLKNTINTNHAIKQLDQKEQLVWQLNSQDREVILAVADYVYKATRMQTPCSHALNV